jgi:hypothetical protein
MHRALCSRRRGQAAVIPAAKPCDTRPSSLLCNTLLMRNSLCTRSHGQVVQHPANANLTVHTWPSCATRCQCEINCANAAKQCYTLQSSATCSQVVQQHAAAAPMQNSLCTRGQAVLHAAKLCTTLQSCAHMAKQCYTLQSSATRGQVVQHAAAMPMQNSLAVVYMRPSCATRCLQSCARTLWPSCATRGQVVQHKAKLCNTLLRQCGCKIHCAHAAKLVCYTLQRRSCTHAANLCYTLQRCATRGQVVQHKAKLCKQHAAAAPMQNSLCTHGQAVLHAAKLCTHGRPSCACHGQIKFCSAPQQGQV